MYETLTFSREELFDKVWETPLTKLAQTIGISDVALAKACRKAGIPLPGRGHWAKAERARALKPKLPALKNSAYQTVRFQVPSQSATSGLILPKAEKGDPIIVPVAMSDPHPLVARTLKAAAKAKEDRGLLLLSPQHALAIRVSPGLLDRTLRLMDALIKASEAQGHRWHITQDGKTSLTVNDETFDLTIQEKVTRRELPPPPPAPRPKTSTRWQPRLNLPFSSHPSYEWIPTGKLTIGIDGAGLYDAPRKNWNDTERTTLESKLHEVLAGFVPAAAAIKANREENERRKRHNEECEARRQEEARRLAHQQHLRARLVRATEQWEQAQRLRAFCAEVAARLNALPPEQQSQAQAWLQWANDQIHQLDPLQRDLADLFNMQAPRDQWFAPSHSPHASHDWWSKGKS